MRIPSEREVGYLGPLQWAVHDIFVHACDRKAAVVLSFEQSAVLP